MASLWIVEPSTESLIFSFHRSKIKSGALIAYLDLKSFSGRNRGEKIMGTILIIVILVVLLGGGGGYYAHGRYGGRGLGGVLGLLVIILIVLWLLGALHGGAAPPL
jgi:hypothetical protein